MVTVKFHGDLKRFEPTDSAIELCVDNFRELMSGLLSQIQGLRQHLRQGYYKVRIGRNRYLSEEQIKSNAVLTLDEDCTVHFTPVVSGAGKGGGFIQAIAGVLIVGLAVALGPVGIGVLSSNAAWMIGGIGASLALGGAMQLLTKPPEMHTRIEEGEKKQSTSFSNIRNLTPQGRPIPLLYGKMMTSLILISQGVESFDEISEAEKQQQEAERQKQTKKAEEKKALQAEIERERHQREEDARDARERREQEQQERAERQEREARESAEIAMG